MLWEPSSLKGDPINTYGTSLALELLPYWTNGKMASMEGLYFESSATTSFHFLTVAECSKHPSNPVRGLAYGTLDNDFDLCVRHLQMLGVRYLMLWTPEAEAKANVHPDLHLVRTIPDLDHQDPKGWKVYEVASSALVEGMAYEPVVAKVHAGTYRQCWHQEWPDPSSKQPELAAWECSAAAWWRNRALLDKPWAASGPSEWQRIDVRDLGRTRPKAIAPVRVTRVHESVDRIAFHVSEINKPVVVRTSYFPNWEAHGANGPYRLAPNLMVVIPTSHDVSLTYGLTGVDWLGRIITVLGLAGLVLLVRWKRAERFAAARTTRRRDRNDQRPAPGDNGGGDDITPPDRSVPAPALP